MSRVTAELRVFHWPLAFPEVFSGDLPGFDVVVGNPPWEEVTVEELAFYARYSPRLRGLPPGPRAEALSALQAARPELADELHREQDRVALLKGFLGPAGGYSPRPAAIQTCTSSSACGTGCCSGAAGGSEWSCRAAPSSLRAPRAFRKFLFESSTVERIDFLLNKGSWAFNAEPRYTVALLVAEATPPSADHCTEVAGVAESANEFIAQSSAAGIPTPRTAMGPDDEVPMVPSAKAAEVLAVMRHHQRFAYGGGRWRCFPTRELTRRRTRSSGKMQLTDGHCGRESPSTSMTPTDERLGGALPPRPHSRRPSSRGRAWTRDLQRKFRSAQRRAALHAEVGKIRLGFRRVSRATDSRTVRASLIPAETFPA